MTWLWVSRSYVRVTRVAIVRMNSLTQKPYWTNKNHCGSTNTGRNDICHVDHDVMMWHSVSVNRDSWNEFPDLKSLRNNKKIIAVWQNTSRDNKGHVTIRWPSVPGSRVNACVMVSLSAIVRMFFSTWIPCETEVKSLLQFFYSDIYKKSDVKFYAYEVMPWRQD